MAKQLHHRSWCGSSDTFSWNFFNDNSYADLEFFRDFPQPIKGPSSKTVPGTPFYMACLLTYLQRYKAQNNVLAYAIFYKNNELNSVA
jgi:hypothetical protein